MTAIAALTENFEGGSNGSAIATGNTIFDNVSSGNTFTNAHAIEGSLAMALPAPSSLSYTRADYTAVANVYFSFYLYLVASATASTAICHVYDGATKICDVRQLSTGEIQLRNVSTNTWTGTTLATGTWHRIELRVSPNSGAGTLQLRVFSGANVHGSTPDQDSGSRTATAAVITSSYINFGRISTDTTFDFILDRIRGDDATWPAPIVSNQTPTANAGTDQNVASGAAGVTLNGSGSSDPDGTIASYNWTQTAGTTVTLSGTGATRTFTAPTGPQTLTFSLTVTDDDGATSAADTVNVVVAAPIPTANAGSDQTNLEPYTTASVTGSASGGSGSGYTYAWSQVSGPTVTLVNPNSATVSFVVPPQAAPLDSVVPVVLELEVTDSNLATDTDQVSLTAYPWDRWHRVSGSWVAKAPPKKRNGGAWV